MEVWWKQHSFCSSSVQVRVTSALSVFLLLADELLHIQQIYSSRCQSSGASVQPAGVPSSSVLQLKALSKEEDGSQGCFPLNVRETNVAPWHGAAVFVCLVLFLSRRFHAFGAGWRVGCSEVCPSRRIPPHLIPDLLQEHPRELGIPLIEYPHASIVTTCQVIDVAVTAEQKVLKNRGAGVWNNRLQYNKSPGPSLKTVIKRTVGLYLFA